MLVTAPETSRPDPDPASELMSALAPLCAALKLVRAVAAVVAFVPPFAIGTMNTEASWLMLLIELTAIEEAITPVPSAPAFTLAAATLLAVTLDRCVASPKNADAVIDEALNTVPYAPF